MIANLHRYPQLHGPARGADCRRRQIRRAASGMDFSPGRPAGRRGGAQHSGARRPRCAVVIAVWDQVKVGPKPKPQKSTVVTISPISITRPTVRIALENTKPCSLGISITTGVPM